jgi:hypothetical protein
MLLKATRQRADGSACCGKLSLTDQLKLKLKMKMRPLLILGLLIAVAATVSGCSTNQNSQQSSVPTISGYISGSANKKF